MSGITYNVGATADVGAVAVAVSSVTAVGHITTGYGNIPNATVVTKVGASATGNNPAVVVSRRRPQHGGQQHRGDRGLGGRGDGVDLRHPEHGTTTSFVFSGTPTVTAAPTGGTAGVPGAVSIVAGGAIQVDDHDALVGIVADDLHDRRGRRHPELGGHRAGRGLGDDGRRQLRR